MDIKGDTLSVVGKGNKERVIPLNEVCFEAINRYLPIRQKMLEINNTTDSDDASKALFLSECKKRISQRTVQELVEKYVKKATQIYVHLSDDHVRTAVTANPLSKRK